MKKIIAMTVLAFVASTCAFADATSGSNGPAMQSQQASDTSSNATQQAGSTNPTDPNAQSSTQSSSTMSNTPNGTDNNNPTAK